MAARRGLGGTGAAGDRQGKELTEFDDNVARAGAMAWMVMPSFSVHLFEPRGRNEDGDSTTVRRSRREKAAGRLGAQLTLGVTTAVTAFCVVAAVA